MLQDRLAIDFILGLKDCVTVQASYNFYTRTLSTLGITESVYAMLLGDDEYIAVTNYRQDFLEEYEKLGGAESDITVLWSQHKNQPLIWNDPKYAQIKVPETYKPVEHLSADYNVKYGFTLPIHTDRKGYWGSIGLSATNISDDGFVKDILPKQDLIMAISAVFDMHIRQFSGNDFLSQSSISHFDALTVLECETLKWLAEGYSIKQISDEKLYRSVDSVNLYIRSAKKKLNARTRDQLIAKALILKLIP